MKWKVRRALFSLSDRTGVEVLARTLHELGCELIATGGTGRNLSGAGLPVTPISDITGNPEAFGGRMKTLSFQFESSLLFDRERDAEEAAKLGVEPIDMVVCNLYPFAEHRARGSDTTTLVENIDIGGPTMLRAAAKNYRYVAVLCDPADYGPVAEELREHEGCLSIETRARLMRKAFNHTADYDGMIAETMDERAGAPSLRLSFPAGRELKSGENDQQRAWVFDACAGPSLANMEQLGGKPVGYNNYVDLLGALEAVRDLPRYGCSVIKHTNPCGLCDAADQRRAADLAWAGDPVSAFGSVVAFNRPLELRAAEFLGLDHEDPERRKFVVAVAAPDFEPAAVEYLRQKSALRILRFDPAWIRPDRELRFLPNACLMQEPDTTLSGDLAVPTAAQPSGDLSPDGSFGALFTFGQIAVRQVKSNAIVVVGSSDDGSVRVLGMGAGQPNRVVSARLAIDRARATLAAEAGPNEDVDRFVRDELSRALMVSEAFFPFPDSIEVAAEAGIRTIVQPGGSIRDEHVVARCDELGVAMITTGIRHFKH